MIHSMKWVTQSRRLQLACVALHGSIAERVSLSYDGCYSFLLLHRGPLRYAVKFQISKLSSGEGLLHKISHILQYPQKLLRELQIVILA